MVGSDGTPIQKSADTMVEGYRQEGLASNLRSKVKKVSYYIQVSLNTASSLSLSLSIKREILGPCLR